MLSIKVVCKRAGLKFLLHAIPRAYKQNEPIVPIPLNSYMLSTRKSKIGIAIAPLAIEQIKMIIKNQKLDKKKHYHLHVKFVL